LGIRVESKSILHCPQSRKGLGQLLDNLHYYFSVTLSRILDEMHRNPDWGINEAILSCQNRYKYLIALLKTNPEQLCISNFFPHPEVEVNTTLLVRLTLSKGCDHVALGRRNGIHVGSRQAGPQSLPSSRSLKPAEASRSRFAIISQPFFPGLATFSINLVRELTPTAWLALR
jgi:hypothetical protein